jgi:hypothetical protein
LLRLRHEADVRRSRGQEVQEGATS